MFTQLDRNQTAMHVRVLGWLVLVTGLLGVAGALCLWFLFTGVGLSLPEPEPRAILPIVGTVAGGFIAVLSCISVIAGIGLLRRTPWGRTVALVDAFLGLVWFPFGTLYGIYAFWVLTQTQAVALFERSPDGDDAGQ
jgi:hypothetical protein